MIRATSSCGGAVEDGFAVSPVPGPSSVLAVLSASGLAVDRFTYVGFLPRRSAARQAEIRRLTERGDAFVVHEAPRRVGGLLADLAAVSPEWELCIGREVTKVFEEFRRGAATRARRRSSPTSTTRVESSRSWPHHPRACAPPRTSSTPASDEQLDRLVRALLDQGVTAKTVAKALSELPGVSHKQAYERVLAIADAPMTITRVVGKSRTAPMATAELAALRAAYDNCVVDVGTGDAHFVYHLASERPDWLVIGLDALDEPMGEIAYRAARKPARGGRPNLVLLRVAIEAVPTELQQIADEVNVMLPWGALLEGIVRVVPDVIGGIARSRDRVRVCR